MQFDQIPQQRIISFARILFRSVYSLNSSMNQPSQSPLHLANPKLVSNKYSFSYQIEQQILPAWQPVPTLNTSITLYSILFIFFATLGILMLIQDAKSKKESFRYDHICESSPSCQITLNVDSKITGPVNIYYKLTNFYQNHRSYLKSKDGNQLKGKQVDINAARSSCGSHATNKEMGWTRAVDGTVLDPEGVAFPCGMMSYSMFNDTFSIDTMTISQSSISIPNIQNQYKNFNLSKQGIDLHNQHYLVWMRPSPQSQFIKLWGSIPSSIQPGVYKIRVTNNYPLPFGEKWIEISNSSVFGNKNNLLAIVYLLVGGLSFLILLAFAAAKGKEKVENVPVFE